jgi:3D (Asp-Asp-Asp) domain-containing protein
MRSPYIFIIILFTLASIVFLDVATSNANVPSTNTATAQVVRIQIEPPSPPEKLTFMQSLGRLLGARPAIQRPDVGTVLTVQASAYAPSPYQTDSTPCLTAAGTRVRRGTIATNFLPMGTIVKINDHIYIVEDRMNPKYNQAIDIFFPSTSEALEFGRQELTIEIIDYGEAGQDLTENKEPNTSEENQATSQDQTTFIDKTIGQINHLRRVASQILGAKVSPDVNRYDVDCFRE